jgi:Na+-transporting methylmalonyl-CoA/oxaloacetate decarboxylase beta subunit
MKKRVGIVLCLLGAAAIILSLLIPIVTMSRMDGAIGIIGGADWPTFLFLLETKFLWLAVCGILGCVAGIVLILLNRVKKDR